ncbi:MAG: nucleotidyltransferase domain-containing protein [Victivallales bacterium]|nr:nucleotidyltransferase domain-containing protein [Victivallales bacterium]
MIDVSDRELKIINDILAGFVPECEVLAFGSRVNGNTKLYSDLDLAVIGKEKLSIRVLGKLREAFQMCELPFRIDVIDWHSCSDAFKNIIEQKYELVQSSAFINLHSGKTYKGNGK